MGGRVGWRARYQAHMFVVAWPCMMDLLYTAAVPPIQKYHLTAIDRERIVTTIHTAAKGWIHRSKAVVRRRCGRSSVRHHMISQCVVWCGRRYPAYCCHRGKQVWQARAPCTAADQSVDRSAVVVTAAVKKQYDTTYHLTCQQTIHFDFDAHVCANFWLTRSWSLSPFRELRPIPLPLLLDAFLPRPPPPPSPSLPLLLPLSSKKLMALSPPSTPLCSSVDSCMSLVSSCPCQLNLRLPHALTSDATRQQLHDWQMPSTPAVALCGEGRPTSMDRQRETETERAPG